MIHVTKLDGASALIPTEAIKYVESIPDTLIYFLNGDSLIVRETIDELLARLHDAKRPILEQNSGIAERTKHNLP